MISLFPFFAFTSSPTCRKTVIHRSIGVKVLLKILHILLFPRGFFFDNPLFPSALSLFTTKNGKFDQCLRPPKPLRGVLFSSKGSVGAATHKPFIHGGLRSTFSAGRCPSQHGSRREFLPRNGVKQSSRCFLTGGRESVNPNRQNLHTYRTNTQHFAPYV